MLCLPTPLCHQSIHPHVAKIISKFSLCIFSAKQLRCRSLLAHGYANNSWRSKQTNQQTIDSGSYKIWKKKDEDDEERVGGAHCVPLWEESLALRAAPSVRMRPSPAQSRDEKMSRDQKITLIHEKIREINDHLQLSLGWKGEHDQRNAPWQKLFIKW